MAITTQGSRFVCRHATRIHSVGPPIPLKGGCYLSITPPAMLSLVLQHKRPPASHSCVATQEGAVLRAQGGSGLSRPLGHKGGACFFRDFRPLGPSAPRPDKPPFFYGFSDASETHRSVIFRIPWRAAERPPRICDDFQRFRRESRPACWVDFFEI